MYVDPKTRFIFGLVITVLSVIGGMGASGLANVFPASWIPWILGWSLFLSAIGNAIQTVFSAGGMTTSGRLQSVKGAPVADRLQAIADDPQLPSHVSEAAAKAVPPKA